MIIILCLHLNIFSVMNCNKDKQLEISRCKRLQAFTGEPSVMFIKRASKTVRLLNLFTFPSQNYHLRYQVVSLCILLFR